MTVKITDWEQNSVDNDLHTLVVSLASHNSQVSVFRLHARRDTFDVQTGDHYVLRYGAAFSLADAKRQALRTAADLITDLSAVIHCAYALETRPTTSTKQRDAALASSQARNFYEQGDYAQARDRQRIAAEWSETSRRMHRFRCYE